MTKVVWTAGTVLCFALCLVQAVAQEGRHLTGSGAAESLSATQPPSPGVSLQVDPLTGEVRARGPGAGFTPGGVQRANVNGSFDFVNANCLDCTGVCPTFERTIEVVLQANAAVSNYGVGGAAAGNYTLTSIGESGNDPIAVGELFTITFTGDVLSCASSFSIFFDVCSPVSPASATGACAPDELQVNSYTTSSQATPGAAFDSSGAFVVTWTSNGSPGDDTSGQSIIARRFASDGSAVGSDFQVNSTTNNTQYRPEVARDSDGDFVVVWTSAYSSGSDSSAQSVQGQRYDSAGAAAGSEFQVNTYTTDRQSFSSVSSAPGGSFVIVWVSDGGSSGTDSSFASIQGQRYASDGTAAGAEFQVNTYTTSHQAHPTVAVDGDGDFVVVWESNGSAYGDTSGRSIQGQRYASDGTATGGQFQVNTITTSTQDAPWVAADSDGDFVVVWRSLTSAGTDNSSSSIQGRRYASDGTAQGADFQVNTYTTNQQFEPSVAADSAGNFVITWGSNGGSGTDTSLSSVQGQVYAADGTPSGGQFQVNTYTTGGQTEPRVATDPAGDFVVVWGSAGSAGDDTSSSSIQRQLFFGPLQ